MAIKIPVSSKLAMYIGLPWLSTGFATLSSLNDSMHWALSMPLIGAGIFITGMVIFYFIHKQTIVFKEISKSRRSQSLARLPFPSFTCLIIVIMACFVGAGGLGHIEKYGDMRTGLCLLSGGIIITVLAAISIEHPRIWFSDSDNVEDNHEKYFNTPIESYPAYQDGIFSYFDNGFTATIKNNVHTILWDDVALIKAYKIDQYMVDCIIIEIHVADAFITVNDQSPGHMKFMNMAQEKLPGFKKDWFMAVAFPAFETNMTLVYDRQAALKT